MGRRRSSSAALMESPAVETSSPAPIVFSDRVPSIESIEESVAEPMGQLSGQPYIVSLVCVVVPFIAFILAVIFLWGRGFGLLQCGLIVSMYIVTAAGITVGYHRYFCHRAFQTPRFVQGILAVFGAMAVQ